MFDPEQQIVNSMRGMQSMDSRRRDVYDSHRHRVFSLAYYMTGNELEAEKILTETFVQAFGKAKEPAGEDVDAALLGELRRRSHLETATGAPPVIVTTDTTAGLTGHNVKRTELEQAIRELPSLERLLFLFHDVEGYTAAAISKLVQAPEAHVQKGLIAARVHLRQTLAAIQADKAEAA